MDPVTMYILAAVVSFFVLLWFRLGYAAWVIGAGLLFAACYQNHGQEVSQGFQIALAIYLTLVVVFGLRPLRRAIISSLAMKIVAKILPRISETENVAIKAGTTWWDGELFTGKPRWRNLLTFNVKKLSRDEKAFLENQATKLCAMLDDDAIYQDRDMSEKVWNYIKKEKFLGMIIPKKYGGLGFGAIGHSAIITKISSSSAAAGVSVMVPNSLGPGELLVHYGTKEQKEYYLPRLAKGQEIPCFALTEPHAGSDATGMRSFGVVTKKKWQGKETLGISLTFEKRYITLAPIATLVGLAFRLYDPKGLLGGKEDLGITCALIPHDTKGMEIGNRHDPMGVPFPNGPIRGKDMFIPMEYVIGGQAQVGNGWRMLMECLSTGRGISLPSLSVGGAQMAIRATTAYSLVREQFGVTISQFEGIQERLVRMAANAYKMDAMRTMTCGAIDAGESPSVMTAVSKAYLTEGMRVSINDAMDVMAGSAIIQGPRNIFGRVYRAIPVGITVEGANILSRSMMVFGQGAIRCHPFILKEVETIGNKDLKGFDKAFFGHINHLFANSLRTFVLALTGGCLSGAPMGSRNKRYYKKLNRLAAAYAFVVDVALGTMGGSLKIRESISGRFADGLAGLLLASATLKRYHDEGQPKDMLPLVQWILTETVDDIENALDGILANLPNRFIACIARLVVFPWGRSPKRPTDKHMHKVVKALYAEDGKVRDALTRNIFIPDAKHLGMGALEAAFKATVETQPLRDKVQKARRQKLIAKAAPLTMAKEALEKGILTKAEFKKLETVEALREDVIQVDEFSAKEYHLRK